MNLTKVWARWCAFATLLFTILIFTTSGAYLLNIAPSELRSLVLVFGFLCISLLLELLIQSALRLFIWLRRMVKSLWQDHTPPYDDHYFDSTARDKAIRFIIYTFVSWWIAWFVSVIIAVEKPDFIPSIIQSEIIKWIITGVALFFSVPITDGYIDLSSHSVEFGSLWDAVIVSLMILGPLAIAVFAMANLMQWVEDFHEKFYQSYNNLNVAGSSRLPDNPITNTWYRYTILFYDLSATAFILTAIWQNWPS